MRQVKKVLVVNYWVCTILEKYAWNEVFESYNTEEIALKLNITLRNVKN